ncbi:MAG: NAD(P)H-hydrate dehydratase [Solirubrobacterales bacterium]|nr:NAD(P)H-hydrate dehydratase [Solirubrobacterales bacterium]
MTAAWLDPVFDAPGMAAADRWAIERTGIPSLDLMETAGRGLADRAAEMAGSGSVAVLCGKGNNGGDGLVAARYLAAVGYEVTVFLPWPASELSPDSKTNRERLPAGVEVETGLDPGSERFDSFTVTIDALFGTGFSGRPREPVASLIESLNRSSSRVLACDFPSGVDGSTGEAELAVKADETVTFHGLKLGHLISPGKQFCGPVEVVDIGIPNDAPAAEFGSPSSRTLAELPRRGAGSNKFSSGRVSLVGGSRGLTGAVVLAAEAAIRSGAGYATAAVPGGLEPIFEARLTEVMTVGVGGERADRLGSGAGTEIAGHCSGAGAVVLGSGFGRDPSQAGLISELTVAIEAPLVLDADGLTLTGGDLGPLASRTAPTVLTPHPGEMGRLLGRRSDEVQGHRLESAWRLARETGAVVVLKGDDTILAHGDRVAVNRLASPALATAGTGDVLAGMVGALLARGAEPFLAACAAVYGHARAGLLAADRVGSPDGVIASDVIAALPRALAPDDRSVE